MPVNATRFLRKMRGGAQAHLLATDAPGPAPFYVTKFTNNPQHRRILVNEWLGAHLLAALGIATPRVAVITVSPAFLAASPEVYLETGSARAPVPPGWHLGSQFPGDPLTEAVYDYLPDSLLPSVANHPDFLGVLAFDKWCGNADARQAIFLRRRLRDWLPQSDPSSPKKGFIAQMIDHGYLFDGPNRCSRDAPPGPTPRPPSTPPCAPSTTLNPGSAVSATVPNRPSMTPCAASPQAGSMAMTTPSPPSSNNSFAAGIVFPTFSSMPSAPVPISSPPGADDDPATFLLPRR